MNYFGILTLLALFFNEYVGLNDHQADIMVGVLTGGITLSMFFLGGISDRIGIRSFIVLSLFTMLIGRVILAAGGNISWQGIGHKGESRNARKGIKNNLVRNNS